MTIPKDAPPPDSAAAANQDAALGKTRPGGAALTQTTFNVDAAGSPAAPKPPSLDDMIKRTHGKEAQDDKKIDELKEKDEEANPEQKVINDIMDVVAEVKKSETEPGQPDQKAVQNFVEQAKSSRGI